LDDSEASLTSADHENGAFDIVVHRLIDHEELPSETIFGCVLTIPGTSYRVREESIYRHRSGSKSFCLKLTSFDFSTTNLFDYVRVKGCTMVFPWLENILAYSMVGWMLKHQKSSPFVQPYPFSLHINFDGFLLTPKSHISSLVLSLLFSKREISASIKIIHLQNYYFIYIYM